jgi:hypothetical protein
MEDMDEWGEEAQGYRRCFALSSTSGVFDVEIRIRSAFDWPLPGSRATWVDRVRRAFPKVDVIADEVFVSEYHGVHTAKQLFNPHHSASLRAGEPALISDDPILSPHQQIMERQA